MLDRSKEVKVRIERCWWLNAVVAEKKRIWTKVAEGVLWTRKEWRCPDGKNKARRKECERR